MKRKTRKQLKQMIKAQRQLIKTMRRMIATDFEAEQLAAEFRPKQFPADPAS